MAGFRKCLPEHTARNLVTLFGMAYHISVIEQCCQMVQFCVLVCRKNSCHTIEKLL